MLRLAVALCLILAAPAAAKPGDLDRTFGFGGRIAFSIGRGYSSAGGMLLDGQGRVLRTGQALVGATPEEWRDRVAAARLTSAGRLDADFGDRGRAALIGTLGLPLTDTPQPVAPMPGGRTVTAAAMLYGEERYAEVYRFDATGRQDMAFGGGGFALVRGAPHLIPVAVATQGDRILILASTFSRLPDHPDRALLIRLLADGSPDPSFGAGGRVIVGEGVAASALLMTGQRMTVATYLPGRTSHPGRVRVSAFRSDGGRAMKTVSFVLRSRDRYADVGPVAILPGPDRSLYIAGNDAIAGAFGGRHWPWVVRVGASGRLVRRFGRVTPVGTRRDYSVRGATLDRHGRIVLAGARGGIDSGNPQATVMRDTPAGRVDRRLGVRRVQLGHQGRVTFIGSEARAVAIDARGRIVLGGVAFDDNYGIREDLGRSYFAAARLKG